MAIPKPIGQGLHGASVPYRHRIKRKKIMAIQGITKPSIRRLARRGGVMRIQKEIYDTIRGVLTDRLKEIISQIIFVMGHQPHKERGIGLAPTGKERKTITTMDVLYVLRRMGMTLYYYDDREIRERLSILPRRH